MYEWMQKWGVAQKQMQWNSFELPKYYLAVSIQHASNMPVTLFEFEYFAGTVAIVQLMGSICLI